MGHIRLGTLPHTRQWRQVLDLLGGGAGTPEVAAATMAAAQGGLAAGAKDPALLHTVWLLAQVPLAARGPDFVDKLRSLGLRVSDAPSLLEVVGAFTGAVDEHIRRNGGRTDLGEMAQMAAAETLTALGAARTTSLFETTSADVEGAFRSLSTPAQFSTLAQEYFTRLSTRYLSYFLSRTLSNYVGGESRFKNIEDHSRFNEALRLHCRQATRIIEEFSGSWFSKTKFLEGDITRQKAAGFVHVAMKKLRSQLAKTEHADEQ
jgi:hypothetical protein